MKKHASAAARPPSSFTWSTLSLSSTARSSFVAEDRGNSYKLTDIVGVPTDDDEASGGANVHGGGKYPVTDRDRAVLSGHRSRCIECGDIGRRAGVVKARE